MKLKTERDLSYIDPLTVEFFQNNRTSSISVILLTNRRRDRRTEGQTNGRDFSTYLAEVIKSYLNFKGVCIYVHIIFIMYFYVQSAHIIFGPCAKNQANLSNLSKKVQLCFA